MSKKVEYEFKSININNLLLDIDNARHEKVEDQAAAIKILLEGSGGEKLLHLARDISTEGTNPAEIPIVVKSPDSEKYFVIEGNRRIACLKLLLDPTLIDFPKKQNLKKKFTKLSEEFDTSLFENQNCIVFETRADTAHWVELRHTGEKSGVGIVKWSATQAERFSKGQNWLALKAIQYVTDNADLDASTKRHIDGIALTNVSRLLGDPSIRDAIGIIPGDGEIISKAADPDQVLQSLTAIIKDVAEKQVTSRDLNSKDERLSYLGKLITSGRIPRSIPQSTSEWKLGSGTSKTTPKRGRPPQILRKYLIPSTCILRIKRRREYDIYREMRRLDSNSFPNAAAAMLRIFFELSLNYYISVNSLRISGKRELRNKLVDVVNDIEKKGKINRPEARALRAASGSGGLFSTETLNTYMHNSRIIPKGADLRDIWDQMQVLIENIWP